MNPLKNAPRRTLLAATGAGAVLLTLGAWLRQTPDAQAQAMPSPCLS